MVGNAKPLHSRRLPRSASVFSFYNIPHYCFANKSKMEKLESNANEMPGFGDLKNLSAEKLQELETVLTSILNLPVARETYAQLIDGKPIRTPYSDDIKAKKSHTRTVTIVSDNPKISDWAIQQYEELRTNFIATFPPHGLKIDLKVPIHPLILVGLVSPNLIQLAQNYQNALPGSRDHLLALLEIAAASVNALAGMVYVSFHQDTKIGPPRPPEGHHWQFQGEFSLILAAF